jgi:osmotically-inducible protein OsmY
MSENNNGAARLPVLYEQETKPAKKPLVQAEAQSRLRKSGYHELHLISCEFHEGVLTLRGRVSRFHLKQVAQELIRQLDGAEEVNNRLEVAEQPCSP